MQRASAACPPACTGRGVWLAARRAAPAQIARPLAAHHTGAAASGSNAGASTAAAAEACASSSSPSTKAAAATMASTAGSTDAAAVVLSTWTWRGHRIAFETAGPSHGKPILLVHGFGASGRHWRRTIPALIAAGHQVFTIDLLGQGRSDKAAVDYSIELWAAQLRDFLAEVVAQPAVLVGNSVGSLASLTAAAEDTAGAVRGLVLLNCAGGMNNKAIADDWRIKLAMPLFLLIDWILLQPRLARLLFEKIRQPDNLKSVLTSVYVNKESVDDELVEMIHSPSMDEGALAAFVKIITGPPGPRPEQLVPLLRVPLLVLWGTADTFTPDDGPVGRYFKALPAQRERTQFHSLPTGHCPMDDDPAAVHAKLLPWLKELE